MQAKNQLVAKSISKSFKHIWLLENESGRCDVEDYLLELPDQDLAKFIAVFERVDADPNYRHPERFQIMDHPVFEFKIFKHRVLCFKTGNNYVCVKAMKKRKDGHLKTTDDAIKSIKQTAKIFAEKGEYDDRSN